MDEMVAKRFCGGIKLERKFLISLDGVLEFWEESRLSREQSCVIVTLKGVFNRDRVKSGRCCI